MRKGCERINPLEGILLRIVLVVSYLFDVDDDEVDDENDCNTKNEISDNREWSCIT